MTLNITLLIQSNFLTFQSDAQSNFLCPLTFTRGGPHAMYHLNLNVLINAKDISM